ncbi:hypothetical protein KHM83_14295 [Fusibacter paucivorans]|uniref:Uncharacterized protein n=1 Tax=Fusibacter paucivorans TaxID=76009 RepID=A0ABS5PTH2_9FIRM|nr:hypothetical protein [Fusibacter paucivorans]MBS7527851.1 hypothetical protein [Fusibacter paucivorans]
MINEVLTGITEKLSEAYPSIPISTEQLVQGSDPAFFIEPIAPIFTKHLAGRYLFETVIDVAYFPGDVSTRTAMYQVALTLFENLKRVEVAGTVIESPTMTYSIDSDVLHFKATYKFMVKEPAAMPEDYMGSVTVTTA